MDRSTAGSSPSSNGHNTASSTTSNARARDTSTPKKPRKNRRKDTSTTDADASADDNAKRRCVSTACIACRYVIPQEDISKLHHCNYLNETDTGLLRKRKSKCDGNTPACAACSQVYNTECIYDPNSDHRRKGVYRKDADALKTRDTTLKTLIQAILDYPEEDVPELVRQIRTCKSLDDVAEAIEGRENEETEEQDEDDIDTTIPAVSPVTPTFETQLGSKMGELRLDDGSVQYIGGTSNLLFLKGAAAAAGSVQTDQYQQQEDPITSWTTVTSDADLVVHLMNMYFTWHYTYFTCLSKALFYRDFLLGKPPEATKRQIVYCTPLLVNAILALGCHFTSFSGARENPTDSATAGDHFFREAKRLIMENDEHEKPKITTVQALALMSVREAGCGREAKGWVYSGMSFRMACDMGLHLDSGALTVNGEKLDEARIDARSVTFWGCFLFDKCWSNYLGRLPQLPTSIITAPKFDVFPDEDSSTWTPCTDGGFSAANVQPSRTRAVALQIAKLCEISNDLMRMFYNPGDMGDASKPRGKQAELKKLSEIHTRLETWRRDLPKEMEPREGGLSSVLIMHMFFQLLFIHLFRPFLKYNAATSPLPPSVSPRKLCTQAATMISKLLRLYKRSFGMRQICNVCVYIAHSACTIHLLNLPNKDARRDIVHGVKHLEEIAEGWLCARRTLGTLSTLAKQWKVDLPDEAAAVLSRTDAKFGPYQVIGSPPVKTGSEVSDASAGHESSSYQASSGSVKRGEQQPHSHQQSQQRRPIKNSPLLDQRLNLTGYMPYSSPTESTLSMPNMSSSSNTSNPRSNQNNNHQTSYALPPQKVTDMRPNPYPSTHSTAISSSRTGPTSSPSSSSSNHYHSHSHHHQQRPRNASSADSAATTNTSTTSPSEMFGGVDQLLHDGRDWVFQDQTQLASGFENWEGFNTNGNASGNASGNGSGLFADEMRWIGGHAGTTAAAGPANNLGPLMGAGSFVDGGGAGYVPTSSPTPLLANGYPGGIAGIDGSGAGYGGISGGFGFGAVFTGYDEDEWYR